MGRWVPSQQVKRVVTSQDQRAAHGVVSSFSLHPNLVFHQSHDHDSQHGSKLLSENQLSRPLKKGGEKIKATD